MARDVSDLKTFTMRLPKELWMFLKRSAAAQELSMTDIIVTSVESYRKKIENKNKNKDVE